MVFLIISYVYGLSREKRHSGLAVNPISTDDDGFEQKKSDPALEIAILR